MCLVFSECKNCGCEFDKCLPWNPCPNCGHADADYPHPLPYVEEVHWCKICKKNHTVMKFKVEKKQ